MTTTARYAYSYKVTCPDCGSIRTHSRNLGEARCRSCAGHANAAAKGWQVILHPGRPDFSGGACVGERGFTEWPLEDQQAACLRCPHLTTCGSVGVWAASDMPSEFQSTGPVFGGVLPADLAQMARTARRERTAAHV